MLFINFKKVFEGRREEALELLTLIEDLQKSTKIKLIPVLNTPNLDYFSDNTSLDLWIQNIGVGPGLFDPEEVAENPNWRVSGTFLNHSDHRYEDFDRLALAVSDCRNMGLKTVVFAATEGEVIKICRMKPDFVAYEPPELIGNSEISVASAKPEVVKKVSEICKGFNLPLIVGAGIHSREDVKRSLELGAVGVAVSKDIVFAKDPKKELRDLIEGFDQ